jgi:hypothetical protein
MDEGEGEGEEGAVRGVRRDAQLFFSFTAIIDWEAEEGDNAAGETEFCCTQGVPFTALASDTTELGERGERRGRMGVSRRMVR